jgi:thiamine biosynthesis lipoprotein
MGHTSALRILVLGSAVAGVAASGLPERAGVSADAQAAHAGPVEVSREAMGTTFTVVAYGDELQRLQRILAASLDEAVRLDKLLSNYDEASEWSKVNREAGRGPVAVSAELFELLSACLAYHRDTNGAFDITVGPLMKTWGFYRGEGTLPSSNEVARVLARVGSRYVKLDPTARTVAFLTSGVELDPGGIGKGYAIDRMVSALRRNGIDRAFLSAGGSTIYGLGHPPDDARGWLARIRDPRIPGRTAAQVFLKNTSLSTSGSYERFFRAGGRVFSHVMDPRTGFPASGISAVSVQSSMAVDSEAWTKAFFVNGLEWARAHRRQDMRVFLCDDADAPSCQWIE